jgi:hypothetical protein
MLTSIFQNKIIIFISEIITPMAKIMTIDTLPCLRPGKVIISILSHIVKVRSCRNSNFVFLLYCLFMIIIVVCRGVCYNEYETRDDVTSLRSDPAFFAEQLLFFADLYRVSPHDTASERVSFALFHPATDECDRVNLPHLC